MTRYSNRFEPSSPETTAAAGVRTALEPKPAIGPLDRSPLTRRALVALGGMLAGTGLGALDTDAKKKKKKKKKKKVQPFALQALNMTGANEVLPTVGDANASGTANFAVDAKGTICATFTFNTTTPNSSITGAHIHKGASTVNGPIVIDFNGKLSECVTVTDKALLEDLKANPGGYYANIHTNNFTNGAVREQLEIKA